MEKVTCIEQLKRGDKIFRIDRYGQLEIIEFLCIHPHNSGYSIFLDINQNPMKKFSDFVRATENWYFYNPEEKLEIVKMQEKFYNQELIDLAKLRDKYSKN